MKKISLFLQKCRCKKRKKDKSKASSVTVTSLSKKFNLFLEEIFDDKIITVHEFNQIYLHFAALFSNSEFSFRNLVQYTKCLMQLVGHFKELSGENKKKVVISFLKFLLSDKDFQQGDVKTEEDKNIMKMIIDQVIDQMIDALILVENKKLKFNKENFNTIKLELKELCCCCIDS